MVPTDVELRPASIEDLRRDRRPLPRGSRGRRAADASRRAHDGEVRAFVGGWDLSKREVWVACGADRVVAFMVIERRLARLALRGSRTHSGPASVDCCSTSPRSLRPHGFCLWVFESNTPARAFYERRGCVELERTDGSANEERSPDLKLAWPGAEPVAFFRGLIDEVDADLGDLLARRAALTAAVQPLKDDPERDPARERAIAEAMARRAPALGADRLTRIVHTIITESLDAAT